VIPLKAYEKRSYRADSSMPCGCGAIYTKRSDFTATSMTVENRRLHSLRIGRPGSMSAMAIFRQTDNLSLDYLSLWGASTGVIGCARNRRSKEGGKTPDHGIGVNLIG
jgi:hypothetical protein